MLTQSNSIEPAHEWVELNWV